MVKLIYGLLIAKWLEVSCPNESFRVKLDETGTIGPIISVAVEVQVEIGIGVRVN